AELPARVRSPPGRTAPTDRLPELSLRHGLPREPPSESLADDELVLRYLRVRQRDDDAVDVAAVVLGTAVDRERPSDSHLPSRLVDVSVQRQQRLHLLDDLAD